MDFLRPGRGGMVWFFVTSSQLSLRPSRSERQRVAMSLRGHISTHRTLHGMHGMMPGRSQDFWGRRVISLPDDAPSPEGCRPTVAEFS